MSATPAPARTRDALPRRPPPRMGMGQGLQRDERTGATFRRLMGYLRPHRATLVLAAVLVVVSTVGNLVAPWLQGIAIDDYIATGDRTGLARIVAVIVAVYVGAWALTVAYSRTIAAIAQRVMAQLRRDLFDRLQRLPMRYFDQHPTGDLMSRVTNDVDAVDSLLSQNLLGVVSSTVQITSLLVIMFALDWRMTLAALVPVPIVLWLVRRLGRLSGPAYADYQRSIGGLNAIAEERLRGQRAVIAMDRQDQARREYAEVNESVRAKGVRAQTLTVLMMPVMFGLGSLSSVAVVGVGALLAVSGEGAGVTIGLIATFVTYASRLGQPLGRIANMVTSMFAALAGATRVFEVIDEDPGSLAGEDAAPLPRLAGHVEFQHVDFAYLPDVPVLRDITFEAQPGQVVGLVGPTGAGKSTIMAVLTRFYDIEEGAVLVDGHDIREVPVDSLRSQVGIVLQSTFLFTDTVAANIRFGRLDATDEEVEAAARLAHAHHFIEALPHGYDTVVSEGGSNLSEGQRQLLAIARAALSQPRLLVLDEATSSVDTRTERDIQAAMVNLMANRTTFVIAHRLSTVRDADQILVLEDGRLTERGTHDTLLDNDGLYAHLYRTQFRGREIHGTAVAVEE